jgi:ATP adenylyltransferase
MLSHLVLKDEAKQQQQAQITTAGTEFNPFLPYEANLFVADLSGTHLCILNKYNVVEHHLLIITRAFEDQENCLTVPDFESMWICLAEYEGLVFYNSGKVAGASQRHKHLQLVPLPLSPAISQIPIAPLIAQALSPNSGDTIRTSPDLPFVHAIALLDPRWIDHPAEAAPATLDLYFKLLNAVGLPHRPEGNGKVAAAYNLLVTREWMLIVPRSQACYASISVNSLGFAGTLLVRNAEQMQYLKQCGPMTLLRNVGRAW